LEGKRSLGVDGLQFLGGLENSGAPIVSERRESALEGDKKTREGVVNGF